MKHHSFIRRHSRALMAMALLALASALCSDLSHAQGTGKIAGRIRDKQTGEPLIGVNVLVKGTMLGAATDEDGFYFILRVPQGVHDLQISMVGYHMLTIRNVKVQIDLTSEMNAALEPTTIETPTVVVTAKQSLVQKDVTSTRRTVSSETMREVPGMESATDVLKLQGGTYLSTAPQTIQLGEGTQLQVRDESVKDVHVRGGRGGEILYMVDGVPMTHPLYGGRSVVNLNVSDVESVELLSGGFNAEYGQAQSGVVNITTRSGGDRLSGGAEYKTDRLNILGESYNTDYGSFFLGGPEPITSALLPELGIRMPGSFRFFLSGNVTLTNTPYNNNRTRDDISIVGIEITERQDNSENFNAKLNWDLSDIRMAVSYFGSWNQWSSFEWLWRDYPNRLPAYKRDNQALNYQISHVLSKATYYSINLGYLGVGYRGSVYGLAPPSFWVTDSLGRIEPLYTTPVRDPYTNFYSDLGAESIWRDDRTRTYTLRFDFTSQVHPMHLIKTGFEAQYNDLSYIDIQDGGTKLSNYGEFVYRGNVYYDPPPGPYPEFGQLRWVFHTQPWIGSAYFQDKFELEYLVLNAGARLDMLLLGKSVMDPTWKQKWEEATGLVADWKEFKYKFSPRFGVSFPISEFTVIFFSYGHFNQLPELQYYYRDPYSGGITGNPKLDYEQTILYEFGASHQMSEDWVIDIKSYAKDVSNLVETTGLKAALGIPVALPDNKGYGRARGLEFMLTKRYSGFTSGTLTYTVQWATGYSSSSFEGYVRSLTDFPNPIRERALGWDVRHQIIFQGTVGVPPGEHPEVFGLKLFDDWDITLLSRFATGLPYTPGPATVDAAEFQKQENTAVGPSTASTDIKVQKRFSIGAVRLTVMLDWFNILNQKNVQMSYGFNTWTGQPLKYGDVQNPLNNFYDWYYMMSLMDPRQFGGAQTAKLGLRVDF